MNAWPRRSPARCGNSLLELTIATVVVGVLMVAALKAAGQSLFAQAMTAHKIQGELLARSLLSEVLQKPYQEPSAANAAMGVDTAETAGVRASYDDVDDYHGLIESPPTMPDSAAINAYAGWARSVSVVWVDPVTLASAITDRGAKQITVAVTRDGVLAATAVGYRTNAP
jgi:Tfp pilus assembly protein PilV